MRDMLEQWVAHESFLYDSPLWGALACLWLDASLGQRISRNFVRGRYDTHHLGTAGPVTQGRGRSVQPYEGLGLSKKRYQDGMRQRQGHTKERPAQYPCWLHSQDCLLRTCLLFSSDVTKLYQEIGYPQQLLPKLEIPRF